MNAISSGTCLAVTFAAALSAQAPAAQPPAKDLPAPRTLTVVGCMRAAIEPNSFVLSDLEWRNTESPTGTSGSTGTGSTAVPPEAASAVTLRLVQPPGGVRLSEHVGHKVEITGTLIDEAGAKPTAGPAAIAAAERTGTGGDRTSRTGEARTPPTKPEQTLNVRTVKMIADRCNGD